MIEAGEIRQSATITTFSVGSMVDFVNGSFMTMGIDFWNPPITGKKWIHEEHLMADLGAKLKPPPWKDPGGRAQGHIKCIRFPTWLVCNNRICGRIGKIVRENDNDCHNIFEVKIHNKKLGEPKCNSCNDGIGIPPRFVCVCTDSMADGAPVTQPLTGGHIEDFPWFQWCHQQVQDIPIGRHRLVLEENDGLSFESMVVRCLDCQGARRSLAGIFSKEFGNLFKCKGNAPWLNQWNKGCGCNLKVFQRGATSIHRPETVTYISIPNVSDSMCIDTGEYFEDFVNFFKTRQIAAQLDGKTADPRSVAEVYYQEIMLPNNFGNFGHDKQRVINHLAKFPYLFEPPGEASAGIDLVDRKKKEYQQLSISVGTAKDAFQTQKSMEGGTLHSAVESVMFVRRLREVTALTGFSRDHGGLSQKGRVCTPGSELEKGGKGGKPSWYPAIELRGEGLFIRLNESRLGDLVKDDHVLARCKKLGDRLRLLEDPIDNQIRGPFRFQNPPCRPSLHLPVNMAKLLVAHTTCHLLMRELTLECGYSSSSLKERLYYDENCFGFLIYASTPGADGTRGGLVRMGQKGRLKPVFENALEKARWCSSDPICATCESQGTDSLNLAGCHSCALLPETSCELRNQFLDRCVVLKCAAGGIPGYFD